jgi:hypothetical protein
MHFRVLEHRLRRGAGDGVARLIDVGCDLDAAATPDRVMRRGFALDFVCFRGVNPPRWPKLPPPASPADATAVMKSSAPGFE